MGQRALRDAESAASPVSPTADLDESPSRSERRRQRKSRRALRDAASAADTASPAVNLVAKTIQPFPLQLHRRNRLLSQSVVQNAHNDANLGAVAMMQAGSKRQWSKRNRD